MANRETVWFPPAATPEAGDTPVAAAEGAGPKRGSTKRRPLEPRILYGKSAKSDKQGSIIKVPPPAPARFWDGFGAER